jgi:hypothetical protein
MNFFLAEDSNEEPVINNFNLGLIFTNCVVIISFH